MATTTKAVPHPTIPGVYTQDESVGADDSYTPTASEQAEYQGTAGLGYSRGQTCL